MVPFAGPAISEKYAAYGQRQRVRLLALRSMIYEVAAVTPGVGKLEETLKWGQPSFLTTETKSGTTIRIDAHRGGGAAIYVNCQTSLVDTFGALYPDLIYEGTRAVVLAPDQPLPEAALRHVIALALTYHARKKRSHGGSSHPHTLSRKAPIRS